MKFLINLGAGIALLAVILLGLIGLGRVVDRSLMPDIWSSIPWVTWFIKGLLSTGVLVIVGCALYVISAVGEAAIKDIEGYKK